MVSERQLVFHDKNDKEMVDRHTRCYLALAELVEQEDLISPSTYEFFEKIDSFRFACVPKLISLGRVYNVNREIARQKVLCESIGITLFKIPRHVNDVEGYVTMLLRKHRGGL